MGPWVSKKKPDPHFATTLGLFDKNLDKKKTCKNTSVKKRQGALSNDGLFAKKKKSHLLQPYQWSNPFENYIHVEKLKLVHT